MKEFRGGKPQSRHMRTYHLGRERLFDALGHVCSMPGCGATTHLEFDVIKPVGDPKSHHGRMSSTMRIAFYKRQHAASNLQVLCKSHNASKRDREEAQMPIPEMPPEQIAEYAN